MTKNIDQALKPPPALTSTGGRNHAPEPAEFGNYHQLARQDEVQGLPWGIGSGSLLR